MPPMSSVHEASDGRVELVAVVGAELVVMACTGLAVGGHDYGAPGDTGLAPAELPGSPGPPSQDAGSSAKRW
jgi:hypothetical protein